MQLNPIFAQGCTKAMVGVVLLDSMLRKCTAGKLTDSFSTLYFKRLEQRLRGAWDTTRTIDYGFPSTTPVPGEPLSWGSLTRRMMAIYRLAAEEVRVQPTVSFIILHTPWIVGSSDCVHLVANPAVSCHGRCSDLTLHCISGGLSLDSTRV
jgi:hypothetical protein